MTCQQLANPAVVVPLAAEIDLTNNEQVYDPLYSAFVSGATVVIADFTATWFCDCSSLRRLLTVQRRAASQGGQLRIMIPAGSPVRRLTDLLGLDSRLRIYASTHEASAWLPGPPVHGAAEPGPAPHIQPDRARRS
jgi:anti-anti-sigma factor